MANTAGSYDCGGLPSLSGWAFKSPTTGMYLSACAAVADLATLADDIGLWDYANGISWTNQVYFGPNDCMSFFNGQSMSTAAGALRGVLQIATTYAQQRGDRVEFTAVVDDEGYIGSCSASSTSQARCQTNDVTFFRDYAGPIGPGGAPPCEASEEETLSDVGGGPAIPQIYVYSNPRTTHSGCTFDGYGPAPGAWPYAIAGGYAGVQTYPIPSGFYSSWEANIRWYICPGATPRVNFDWSYPGGRG